MKMSFYIDGFNLYYGCLKGTPHRWLNLRMMCERLFPKSQIERIVYCTALVKPRPSSPLQRVHQETYIRALETTPNMTVVYGNFLSSTVNMLLAHPTPTQKFALVQKSEEKGSDVNLATYLLMDGFRGNYEAAVVVSNDSDLALPIQVVGTELNLPVHVVNPHKKSSWALQQVATSFRKIRPALLAACQFPSTMTDANGTFQKPPGW